MPDHVHILIRRHRDRAEELIARFRKESKAALIQAGNRPVNQPVWNDGAGWKTFVTSRREFENEIEYIRQNPVKIGRPEQTWDFVMAYDGWLPE
jgi:REP element-mobilizing transposase RayT